MVFELLTDMQRIEALWLLQVHGLYCTFSNCLTPTSYDFNGQTDGQSIENISALVVSFAHTNLNSMAVSVFASEKPLVGAGYAISIHLSINGPRKQYSHLALPPIPVFEVDFSARVSYYCSSILIESSLTSGCG